MWPFASARPPRRDGNDVEKEEEADDDDETDAESSETSPPSDDSDSQKHPASRGSPRASPRTGGGSSPRSPANLSTLSAQARDDVRREILQQWCRATGGARKKGSSSSGSGSGSARPGAREEALPVPALKAPGKRKHPTPPPRSQDLHDIVHPAEAATLPASVYPGYEDKLVWYCDGCATFHVLTSTHALSPFTKKHGLVMRDVEQDGDCFYSCVIACLRTDHGMTRNEGTWLTVERLRDLVARRVTEEQLEFYRMEAVASPKATHLDFIRPAAAGGDGDGGGSGGGGEGGGGGAAEGHRRGRATTSRGTATARNSARMATLAVAPAHPVVTSVDELRAYTRREGQKVGMGNCLWADSFAQMVIGEGFRLTILLIDMERERGCFPFRVMHKFEDVGPERVAAAAAAHSKSLFSPPALSTSAAASGKRETRRSTAGSGPPPAAAAASASSAVAPIYVVKEGPERFIILKRQGPVGHFQYVERASDGRAVFVREELPSVVKALWGL